MLWFTVIVGLLGYAAAMYLVSRLDQALRERELRLQESKALVKAIVATVVDGVMTLDRQGNIETFNPAAAKMFGYEPEEVIGQELKFLVELPPYTQGREDVLPTAEDSPIKGGQSWRTLGRRKVGAPFPIEISISHLHLDERLIAIVRDVTEREQAAARLLAHANELARLNIVLAKTNAALKDRNKELDQFAYVASHDLKAPLRAIANLSEWIEEDLRGQLPEDNQYQLRLLRGWVHRMEALINGLLEYSRIDRIEARIETVAVELLLREIIDSLAPPSEFTIRIETEMPTLTTKRLPLRQVFANLISNAIKHHTRPDGHIWISAQHQDNCYEFAVADDGPGIAPEYHEKIFTIFQTLEARDKSENTGVGLSIVKKIVDAEGGTIQIEAQPGQGATFRFTWPT